MKWNADLYDDKHSFVFQYGENVLEMLNLQAGERVLDLGCGTGYLTNEIKLHGGEVTGIDSSAEMIKKAQQTYPGVNFGVADACNFQFAEPFDAVFSNAVLHWINSEAQDAMMRSVYESLKPGGRFVAEMGGRGNVAHLTAAAQQVLLQHGYVDQAAVKIWYFPALGEYTSRLEEQGFRVTYAAHFDRPTLLQDGEQGVAKWITMFGGYFLQGIPEDEKQEILKEITALLEPHYNKDGKWYSDYKRLRFIAIKE